MSTNGTNGVEVMRVIPPQDVQVLRRDDAFMPIMNIGRAVERYNALVEFTQQIMKDGKDFGTVPGTDKPTLLKPGAEKLCNFFGLSPRFSIIEKVEQWDGDEPLFYFVYKCQLLRGDTLLGEGDGSCNSRESKYRYRWVNENNLPAGLNKAKCEARGGRMTEFDFAVDKAETTGKYGKPASYWKAFRDAIDAGTATKGEKVLSNGGNRPTWTIDMTVYRVPNPDVCDQINTIQKMAQKRSFIAATLIACNASEYYTQDVEDLDTIDSPAAPPIDTGGHAVGTQAAADHVAARKIADLKKAEVPPAVKRATEAPPATEQTAQPDDVQKMFARMTDIKSTLTVFSNLKASLVELIGQDAGERIYYTALGKQGVEHANQFKSTKPARLAAREMLDCIREAQQRPPYDDLGVSREDAQ